jgi:V-type H+-transporting ATPase subunit C
MHLNDGLLKLESNMEALLKKVERQFLDVTEKTKHDFKVKTGDGETGLEEFLKNFRWDEAKFSRTNQLSEVIKNLTQVKTFSLNIDSNFRQRKCIFANIALDTKLHCIRRLRTLLRKFQKRSKYCFF